MAETFALPQDDEDQQAALVASSPPLAQSSADVTGLNQPTMPEIQTSGSSPPGALNQTERTPVSGDQQPGGGGPEPFDPTPDRGNPEDALRTKWRENAEQLTDMQEGILKRQQTATKDPVAKAQAVKMTDTMKAQGADPAKAVADNLAMAEKEVDRTVEDGKQDKKWGTKIKKRLRNVYNTIPEDEMGLFLMEFGLRAMMAGETMGTMGALGAAGSGALSSLQGRQQAEKDRALEAERYADTAALEDRKVTAAETTAAKGMIIEAEDGFYRMDPETGELAPLKAGDKTPKPAARNKGQFRDQVARDALVAAGYEENQANLIIYAGGKSVEEATAIAEDVWAKNLDKGRPDFIGSSEWRGMSDTEKKQYEADWKQNFIDRVSVKRNSALSDEEAAQRALQATAG